MEMEQQAGLLEIEAKSVILRKISIFFSKKKYKPRKDFEEFVIMMASTINNFEDDDEIDEIFRLISRKVQENQIQKLSYDIFRVFDKDGDGFITVDELAMTMLSLDETLGPSELKEMMDEVDSDRDGKISYRQGSKTFDM